MTYNDQEHGFRERARISFEESMILTATVKRVAAELGMPRKRFWEIRRQVEVDFNQWLLEEREQRGRL